MPFTALVAPPVGVDRSGRWYLVSPGDEVLVTDDGDVPTGIEPVPELARTEGPVFLGLLDGVGCWAAGVSIGSESGAGAPPAIAPDGYRWERLRDLGMAWPLDRWMLAGRAVQLVEWWRTSRFCGRCATATVQSPGERAMRCPNCGLLAYPRLAPAVIVLIRRGDRALLARGAGFRGRMFSTLAGFVEPGETLEQAVHREVEEEVGVKLREVRYFGSQPWPFPHSLMVGFTADWESGEIEVDGEEIVEAGWFTPDQLPPMPPSISIARRLIDDWIVSVS